MTTRDTQGRFAVSRKKFAVIGLLLAGIFVYCAPMSANQGSKNIDPVTAEHLTNGDCERIDNALHCNFSDKETLRKWAETYPEHLEKEINELKIKAGLPSAILRRVCREEGLTDDDCPRILYGMAMQESKFGKLMIGDSGRSEGYFHILDIHKLSDSCKYDLECSARFSLKRMIRYGFESNRDVAVMAHNGTPGIPATLAYLSKVKTYMNGFDSLK